LVQRLAASVICINLALLSRQHFLILDHNALFPDLGIFNRRDDASDRIFMILARMLYHLPQNSLKQPTFAGHMQAITKESSIFDYSPETHFYYFAIIA
jgi:hypothetical protein